MSFPVRHRRPGRKWHTTTPEISVEKFRTKRRIMIYLEDGASALQLSPGTALALADLLVDAVETGRGTADDAA